MKRTVCMALLSALFSTSAFAIPLINGVGGGSGDQNDKYLKCTQRCQDKFNLEMSAANQALQAAYDALSACHDEITDKYQEKIDACPDATTAPTAHETCVNEANAFKDEGNASCHADFDPQIDAANAQKDEATNNQISCMAGCLDTLISGGKIEEDIDFYEPFLSEF
ncbi:MAG: hypothetical protein H6619_02575 [Deltaproteobacteria bacterium]|nr:hypothetical protein [Deltaproteobacteria bacterium]